MNDVQTYFILLRGRIDSQEIGGASPLRVKVECLDAQSTRLEVHTDQSGVIGLLRYLHGRGFVLLSVNCEHEREKQ